MSRLTDVPSPLEPFRVLPSEVVHLGMYLVLGGALAFGRRLSGLGVPHLLLIAVGSAYGAVDEWHQSFVPGRTPAVTDWVVDTIGVVAGYLLITYFPGRQWGSVGAVGAGRPEQTDGT